MGAEATCTARFKGRAAAGKARLEAQVLQFRGGDLRLSIPFEQMSKIAARGGTLSVTFPGGRAIGRVVMNCDAIFFGATKETELARIETLKASLKPNGALWIIRPMGRPEIAEGAVMAAGKDIQPAPIRHPRKSIPFPRYSSESRQGYPR